jgi:hypothetical protein
VGASGGGYLSAETDLPAPAYDTTIPWTISAKGENVTIRPAAGQNGQLDGTIAFTLPQIPVDDTPTGGVVGLTILEAYSSGGEVTDSTTYQLVKQPADFVIVDFRASPAVLDDIDQTVTLYWSVDTAGQSLAYKLHSDDWQPDTTFDANDGQTGVPTDTIDRTTTFTLDVLEAGTVAGSVPLTVPVEVPWVSENSYFTPSIGATGRIVALHWATRDAARCSVEVNGITVDASAAVDTYNRPYPLALPGPAGSYDLGVTAHAATGPARAAHQFGPTTVTGPVTGGVLSSPQAAAITADGTLALVPNVFSANVSVVHLATGQTEPQAIPSGSGPYGIGITADGALAVVLAVWDANITPIDVNARKAEPAIPVGNYPQGMAVAPDGSVAIALPSSGMTIVDLPAAKARPTVTTAGGMRCVITPDSKLGLVLSGGGIAVVELPSGDVEPQPIPVGGDEIAMSPDGTFALVTSGQSVARVDIAARAPAGSPIPLPWYAGPVAISPDGGLAVVVLTYANAIGLVDLTRARPSPTTIPVGDTPRDVKIAKDGSSVVVVCERSTDVVVL